MRRTRTPRTSLAAPGVGAWLDRRARRQRRRETIELCAYVVASQVLCFAVFTQFYRGAFAGTRYADVGAFGAVAVAIAVAGAAVASPGPVGKMLAAAFSRLGIILRAATAAMVAAVYFVTLPFAATLGRRRFVAEHRHGAAWADRSLPWRTGGWVDKRCEGDGRQQRSRSALFRLLGYFVGRRNVFLLTVTCILLAAVSLSILTHVPYIAPFVYTLF
jgi:hypothetical protein